MKVISKETVIAMRADIDKALKSVGEKYGVELTAGNATYSDLECTFKLKASLKASGDFNPQKILWEQYAPGWRLPKEAFGQEISISGVKYRICGVDPKARTNKILIENANGQYKCDIQTVTGALVTSGFISGKEYPPHLTPAPPAGKPDEATLRDFEVKAFMCGLTGKCSYGQEITFQGRKFRLEGFNTKAPQYPLICVEISSGKSYRLPKSALDA